MAFETVQIPYEQTPLLTGYISNTSNPDKIFSEEVLENMLAEKDAINRRNQEATERAERDYKVNTALNIGGGVLQLGSALIPFGGLGTVAGTKLLSPLVGKAIGSAIGRGLASGAIGGGLYGMGDAISQAKPINEIAQEGLYGAGIGGLTGGLLGGVGGKIGQGLAKRNLRKTGLDPNGEYFNNYIDGLYQSDKIGGLDLQSQPLQEYRALASGLGSPSGKGRTLLDSANPLHRYQADLINRYNPANDDYHTWVRTADDIYTFEDTLKPPQFDVDFIGNDFTPDYTWDMAQNAIKNGEIEVFSSYPIEKGIFVTPSEMEALSYSGTGKVYNKTVPLEDVAWIDPSQGQYAPIDKEYMEAVMNDAKKGIKTLNKKDYRRLGKKYYTENFMPNGVNKSEYGNINYSKANKGKDSIQVIKHYPEMTENLNNAEYAYTSNHKNEVGKEYDHFINTVDDDVLDFIIENRQDGKKVYKMTDKLNNKKR